MAAWHALTLFVLRHGECEHNIAGWIASHNDSPLTERGREQARRNGKLLHELAPPLDAYAFYASSLHRACATMELLLQAAGLPPGGYRADWRLMEQNVGDHIGVKWKEIDRESDAAYRAGPWTYHRPGGESHADVFARVGGFLNDLKGNAVIVTHAQPTRMLHAHFLGLAPEQTMAFDHPNAAIMRLAKGTAAFFGD